MLLQTNSYVVPKERRAEHARLMRRFRHALSRIGCEHFEVYEQVGPNWGPIKAGGRFVQLLRFRDRQHQLAVQNAERHDPAAQDVIRQFCEMVNLPYQQEKGLFAIGFYNGVITTDPMGIWQEAQDAGGIPVEPVEPTEPPAAHGDGNGHGNPPAAQPAETPLRAEAAPNPRL